MPRERLILIVLLTVAFAAWLVALQPREELRIDFGKQPGPAKPEAFSNLPMATTNNAVAVLKVGEVDYLYSFSGLGAGKERTDIHSRAFAVNLDNGNIEVMGLLPGGRDRLASIAVGLFDRVFVIGGYTVGEDGSEVSTPEVLSFNPKERSYKVRAAMPLSVDDTVAFSYANRYIYLVSGWHDDGNVSNVQVFDSWEDRWFEATPYPGAPVFGHAGGIVANRFVIADGVKLLGHDEEGRRQFGISAEAYLGIIDEDDPASIRWQALSAHPGPPLYRMAATGSKARGQIVFAGGSPNPYNYNGMGYNGQPSEPSAAVFAFDPATGSWIDLGAKPVASMDHRGLLEASGAFYTIGGMLAGQVVTGKVLRFELPD
ncbi:MAG: hypothetical protein V3R73_01700 [Sphingomonadales bacterium]